MRVLKAAARYFLAIMPWLVAGRRSNARRGLVRREHAPRSA